MCVCVCVCVCCVCAVSPGIGPRGMQETQSSSTYTSTWHATVRHERGVPPFLCRLDKSPLVPGCKGFTCHNHTRAYVHHLLQVGLGRVRVHNVMHTMQAGRNMLSFSCFPRLCVRTCSILESNQIEHRAQSSTTIVQTQPPYSLLANAKQQPSMAAHCTWLSHPAHSHARVQAHEMLAEILLDLHNSHHHLAFFDAMRCAVQVCAGTFPYQGAFMITYLAVLSRETCLCAPLLSPSLNPTHPRTRPHTHAVGYSWTCSAV
jgi:hypothetical protein